MMLYTQLLRGLRFSLALARGAALRNSATRALRRRRACVSADIHCADTVASCAFHSSRAGRGVCCMRRRENAADISMNSHQKKPTMRSASTVAFAFCATIAFMLASTSMAQSAFYDDSSCSVLCNGVNCNGAKFFSNPIPASAYKVGDCVPIRSDTPNTSSRSVIFSNNTFRA
jgi:hypothetical protein